MDSVSSLDVPHLRSVAHLWKRQHTPKSPLNRGDIKKRYDRKMPHTPSSHLDREDGKRRILVPPLLRGG